MWLLISNFSFQQFNWIVDWTYNICFIYIHHIRLDWIEAKRKVNNEKCVTWFSKCLRISRKNCCLDICVQQLLTRQYVNNLHFSNSPFRTHLIYLFRFGGNWNIERREYAKTLFSSKNEFSFIIRRMNLGLLFDFKNHSIDWVDRGKSWQQFSI